MIEQEIIDTIKTGIDIISLIESKGIQLKKNGKGYVGLCPFHDDQTPSLSVTPSTNLWQCFGCGAGGDVIRFIELYDKINFPEAVKQLDNTSMQTNFSFNRLKESDKIKQKQKISGARAKELLERTATIYESTFAQSPEATAYLESRHIKDAGLLTHHRTGYCDGTLHTILPDDPQIKAELQTIGILNENNYERFKDCIVFPVFDTDGNIITIYGRHTKEKRHIYLPNRPTGLWNGGIIKTCPEVILVESVIDALSVMTAGYPNVISIQSANGLTEHEALSLSDYGVQKIVLLLDGDEAGKKAEKRLKEKLSVFNCHAKKLPDGHDPNSYLQKSGAEKLAEIIRQVEPSPAQPAPDLQHIPDGFSVTYGLRTYQVIGLEKSLRKLKATVKIKHGGKLHVDTLDFYSARARKALSQDICRIFEEIPDTITADITRLITVCETASEQKKTPASQEPSPLILSDTDQKEAENFGKSTDLINRIISDFESCGLIGEDANKLLGYIAMTSRKLTKPLSMLILSSSGSGKTALQDAVTAFCPPEDLIKLTSLSGKALFYKEQNSLKQKVLALEEGVGAEDASYAIRNLISSGVLVNETTIKDLSTGRLTTMENRVEGPTAVFLTTTNPNTDPETMSRFFVTGIDESRQQTRKILEWQRKNHMPDCLSESLKTEKIKATHRNFQRLLKQISIRNPFADQLTYGDERLQGRRDQPKYLVLIKAVCFLRQMQKDIHKDNDNNPYIDVDTYDISIANKLAHEILGRSLDELSRPGRDLLMQLDEMIESLWQKQQKQTPELNIKRTDIGFTRREIREFTGWSNYRVHTHLKELTTMEYVIVESGKNGMMYRYRLAYESQGKTGESFMLGLSLKGVDDADLLTPFGNL